MLFDVILLVVLGLVFIFQGFIIWKKEKIDLIHRRHREKVSDENKKQYTAIVGKGSAIIGVGMLITGIMNFFIQSNWDWIVFGVCFFIGFGFCIYAIMKYNR